MTITKSSARISLKANVNYINNTVNREKRSLLKHYSATCIAIVTLILASIMFPLVAAHAPLGTGDNESLDKATVIPDPTKSWALYSALNKDSDPQYYTFNVTAGQKIHVTMYKSMRDQDVTFNPRLVLIGPGITLQGNISSKITVPSGLNAQLVNQTEPTPTFEPFSPGTFTGLADTTLENPTPGKYYLVVFEQSDTPKGGNYGLAVGDRETYTIDEWVLIPFNLMNIYQWEGQNFVLILIPMITSLVVGIILVAWQLRRLRNLANPMTWMGAIAGLTFIGTGATTLGELISCATKVSVGVEAMITLIFALVPLALGLVALKLSIKNGQKTTLRKRIYFVILGVAAMFIWAGLIVGPILAIITAVMPTILRKKK